MSQEPEYLTGCCNVIQAKALLGDTEDGEDSAGFPQLCMKGKYVRACVYHKTVLCMCAVQWDSSMMYVCGTQLHCICVVLLCD